MADRSYEITPDALTALEAEIAGLEGEGRRAMAERIRTARAWGDLKENAEYHDAKDAQAHLETKILRLQDRRRHAIVVEPAGGDVVSMGSTVLVRDEASGRESAYTVVGATEADPTAGRLSIEAPLAQSLLGGVADAVVDFEAPRGIRRLRILSVR